MTTALSEIKSTITKMEGDFANSLPSHIPVDKFLQVANVHLANVYNIDRLDRQSIYKSVLEAANDGLLLNGKDAAIVPRKGKACYEPMVAGIIKQIYNSPLVDTLHCHIVCKNDLFKYNPASSEAPMFEPDWFGDRGAPIGVFAVIALKSGRCIGEIMTKDQIQKIQSRSMSSSKGPWQTDPAEMWRKTVIRRLRKYIPKSNEQDYNVSTFNAEIDYDDDALQEDNYDTTTGETRASSKVKAAMQKSVVDVEFDESPLG